MKRKLLTIYQKLYRHFGPQKWWPADSAFEVIIGAILTQNTSWQNAEKAIISLKKNKFLSVNKILRVSPGKLAKLIKPSGYYNQKAKKLKNMVKFLKSSYGSKLGNMKNTKTYLLREQLLRINGIGPETADSVLLYALNRPVFVVDAYTKRIFKRLKLISPPAAYEQIQSLFTENLPLNAKMFNEYHALIVALGKNICKKNPVCSECVLKKVCSKDI